MTARLVIWFLDVQQICVGLFNHQSDTNWRAEKVWLKLRFGLSASDYLVKQFSRRELLARIDTLILRRRMQTVERNATRHMHAIFSQAPVAIAKLISRASMNCCDKRSPGRPDSDVPRRII